MTTRKILKGSMDRRKKSPTMLYLDELIGHPMSFASLIKSTRLAEESTLAEFAKRLKISVSHLSDIENGRKFVSPLRAAQFAVSLGFSKEQYIRLALQDQLVKSNLDFIVSLKAA